MLWQFLSVIDLHDFRCYLHVASWSLTPLQFSVFMHCLGSFLLQDVLLNLHEFGFGGQNMKFTVNMLLKQMMHSIL